MEFKRFSQVVMRTPANPLFKGLMNLSVKQWLEDPEFLLGIYIASPGLYTECIRLLDGNIKDKKAIDKLEQSIQKYILRSSSRCTPFGTFAGCSLLSVAPSHHITYSRNSSRRTTRLDMGFLCALEQHLLKLPEVKVQLTYYQNTSIYAIENFWRYVEYQYKGKNRVHTIIALEKSTYLDKVIQASKEGIHYLEVVNLFLQEGFERDEIVEFIDDMIASRVLVSEMEPAITGPDYLTKIIEIFNRLEKTSQAEKILNTLNEVKRLLLLADKSEALNAITCYREIVSLLKTFRIDFDESKIFQVDYLAGLSQSQFGEDKLEKLDEIISVLEKVTPNFQSNNLVSFQNRFRERYEGKKVPLLEALDTETGIGYLENASTDITPLLDGVHFETAIDNRKNISLGYAEQLLLEKLENSGGSIPIEIELTESDIQKITEHNLNSEGIKLQSSPSFHAMFKIVSKNSSENGNIAGQTFIFPEIVGGSSAINLLARFAHLDAGIEDLIKEVVKEEETNNPDVIFAEIIHLPESRVGNILLHPRFRDYEIPYLAASSAPMAYQIALSDLTISMQGNEIILWSEKLNKRIIPRLSNAHNYSFNAQPIYQFLCDLQNQKIKTGLFMSWGSLEQFKTFLPRLIYKEFVLAPAQWSLSKNHYEHLYQLKDADLLKGIDLFLQKWKIPQHVVLADGDNELLLDLHNTEHVRLLLNTVRQRGGVKLKEFLFPAKGSVVDGEGMQYNSQFIAVYTNNETVYNGYKKNLKISESVNVQREFGPGSEWLYLKWYCGYKTADHLLEHYVAPVIDELKNNNLIDQWFFIRYSDPQFHLRLRFHITDKSSNTGKVLMALEEANQKANAAGLIWKSQADTYVREIERYGSISIQHAEALFNADSECWIEFLKQTGGDERDEVRWLWAMRSVDELLTDFSYPLHTKAALLDTMKKSFHNEFNASSKLFLQLNDFQRKNKKLIDQFLKPEGIIGEFSELIFPLKTRSAKIWEVVHELLIIYPVGSARLNDLLYSFIHMTMNRICTSKARKQEMIVYDFLHRHYNSAILREKGQIKSKQAKTIYEKI